jgi:hypothetical protein
MSRKKEPIVRHSGAALASLRAEGKRQTDWSASASQPVPDGSDPEDALQPIDWATTELPIRMRK